MTPDINKLVDVARIDRTLDDLNNMTPEMIAQLPAVTFHKIGKALDNVTKAMDLVLGNKIMVSPSTSKLSDLMGEVDKLIRESK